MIKNVILENLSLLLWMANQIAELLMSLTHPVKCNQLPCKFFQKSVQSHITCYRSDLFSFSMFYC